MVSHPQNSFDELWTDTEMDRQKHCPTSTSLALKPDHSRSQEVAIEIACAECGKPFVPLLRTHKCCSTSCRRKLLYKKLTPSQRTYVRVRFGKWKRSRNAQTPWIQLIRSAKDRARLKRIAFDLTDEWGEARWTGRCEVTGIEFDLSAPTRNGPRLFGPSVDRIDSSKSYTMDNCRIVLLAVNAFKNDGTDEDMYLIANALIANHPK